MRVRRQPEWTDANDPDPGIALVELLGYLGDQLGAYADHVADESWLRSRRRVVIGAAALSAVGLLWWSKRDGDG